MSRLVSVVIPAYNAAGTIDATLHSVRAQTWPELEIIVIDDGSDDATPGLVRRHMIDDQRIRLTVKLNGGVASARNLGIEQANGALIAPVDADDLWRPTKIEKQLAALESGGERVALVYTWYAVIDERDRILSQDGSPISAGDVVRRMCMGNLVGNGSSPLMRRSAILEAGGYDPVLRSQEAEGCEDLKLYFAIAERHHFAVVKEHLTGYRQTSANMSCDGRRMLRSYDLVMEPRRAAYHPAYADEFHYGRGFIIIWLMERALRAGRFGVAAALHRELRQHGRDLARRSALRAPASILKNHVLPRLGRPRIFLDPAAAA